MTRSLRLDTPLGPMTLTASERAIVGLHFGEKIPAGSEPVAGERLVIGRLPVADVQEHAAREHAAREYSAAEGRPASKEGITFSEEEITALLRHAAGELDEYFTGRRCAFTLPLGPRGTEFQQRVWKALESIPYGQTRSYRQIAEQIGSPHAFRAVGMANNHNPIAILIPCHRVIGSDGSMTGYAAGIGIKEQLLAFERRNTPSAGGKPFAVGTTDNNPPGGI